ncbi:MAG: DUF2793 domain-containing protein [Synergistaceae bacterium]|nr:DUF2793 domain-containing protein [Synergistaceae bacterium]
MTVSGTVDEPPSSPAPVNGTQYIVGDAPTGAFATATPGALARWDGYEQVWKFFKPAQGQMELLDASGKKILAWDGTEWAARASLEGGSGGSSTLQEMFEADPAALTVSVADSSGGVPRIELERASDGSACRIAPGILSVETDGEAFSMSRGQFGLAVEMTDGMRKAFNKGLGSAGVQTQTGENAWKYRENADGSVDVFYAWMNTRVGITDASGNMYRSGVVSLTFPPVVKTVVAGKACISATVSLGKDSYAVSASVVSVSDTAINFMALSGGSRETTAYQCYAWALFL